MSVEWAAAIDSDDEFVVLPPMLRRVLERYAASESAGPPSPTKTDLYKGAIEYGWLPIPRRFRR